MSLVSDPSVKTEPRAISETPQSSSPGGATEDMPYAIPADVFFAMIEAEVFPEAARVYLQEGRIYEKMAKTRSHSMMGWLLTQTLVRGLPDGWMVFPEGEFRLDDWNAKLPDFAVMRGADRKALFASKEPLQAADLALVVEIAVTSLSRDLGENLEHYARAMIPTYWVADVAGRRLLSHTGPKIVDGRGSYENVETVLPGGSLILTLDGQAAVRFAYEDLMP